MGEKPPAPDAEGAARRCGIVAIIGAPNAGKSTLVNALVGAKVTIVSRKVQTTRVPVRGIAIEGASQLVFIDTPGIFQPKRRLDKAMVDAAWSGAADADSVDRHCRRRQRASTTTSSRCSTRSALLVRAACSS